MLFCTVATVVNSCLAMYQKMVFGRRVANTTIADPPIFIVGHWRTGTTLLHELLALDERHTPPTTYECIQAIISCSPGGLHRIWNF